MRSLKYLSLCLIDCGISAIGNSVIINPTGSCRTYLPIIIHLFPSHKRKHSLREMTKLLQTVLVIKMVFWNGFGQGKAGTVYTMAGRTRPFHWPCQIDCSETSFFLPFCFPNIPCPPLYLYTIAKAIITSQGQKVDCSECTEGTERDYNGKGASEQILLWVVGNLHETIFIHSYQSFSWQTSILLTTLFHRNQIMQ